MSRDGGIVMQPKHKKQLLSLAKLVIELDGSQHYEDRNVKKDADRTAFLEGYGLRVIRISNNEVGRNFREACEYIDAAVKQSLSQLR